MTVVALSVEVVLVELGIINLVGEALVPPGSACKLEIVTLGDVRLKVNVLMMLPVACCRPLVV